MSYFDLFSQDSLALVANHDLSKNVVIVEQIWRSLIGAKLVSRILKLQPTNK